METITVKPNQTIYDLAVKHYGTCEAVYDILQNNPALRNDKTALAALGIDYLSDVSFYFDLPVEPGFVLQMNTDSRLIKNSVIKEINNEVTTFNL